MLGFEYGTTPDGVRFVHFVDFLTPAAPANDPVDSYAPAAPAKGLVGSFDPNDLVVRTDADSETTLSSMSTPNRLLPQGLWSDETTLWVLAQGRDPSVLGRLYAFVLANGNRDSDKDIALDVPANSGGVAGLWMTEDTVWTSVKNGYKVYAYHRNDDTADPSQFDAGDRKPASDFTFNFRSIFRTSTMSDMWSDGSDIYVAGSLPSQGDLWRHRLNNSSQGRQQVLLAHDNDRPSGVWSDGTVLWVAERNMDRVLGYTPGSLVHQPYRDMAFDIPKLAEENNRPRGLWSDGENMWVGNEDSRKVYVYDLPGDPRLSSLSVSGVNLSSFDRDVYEYSRNVAGDITQVTVDPEPRWSGAEVKITPADADTSAGGDGHQVDLVENSETTITVAVTHNGDTQEYTVTLTQLEGTTGTLSSEARLSALTLSGVTLEPAFNENRTRYSYALTAAQETNGLTTTVTATPMNSNADVQITPADSDTTTATTHEVVTGGKPVVVDIVVTPQDGSNPKHYAVAIRGSTRISRDSSKDITADGALSLFDLWSDGDTMWVLSPAGSSPRVQAYDLDTGDAVPEKDYLKGDLWNQGTLRGMWADGDTLWTSESFSEGRRSGGDLIKAIDMEKFGRPRAASGESFIRKETERISARDLWSDGATIWVAFMDRYGSRTSLRSTFGGKLWAYDFETKERAADKDIPITTTGRVSHFFRGRVSHGIWSDGTTMWVVSDVAGSGSTLEAYKLSDGSRTPGLDVLVGQDGIHSPRNMWSNGETMWVVDSETLHLHAYELPANAKLSSLEMSDVDFGHFIHGRPDYSASVANDVSETTVSWEQAHTGGSAAVAVSAVNTDGTSTTDADDKDGYQVSLAEGTNTITITVTAPNGADAYTYTVTVTRAPS